MAKRLALRKLSTASRAPAARQTAYPLTFPPGSADSGVTRFASGREQMQGRNSRRWFTAIPMTGRFHIMFVILLLSEVAIVVGACAQCSSTDEARHGPGAGCRRAAFARSRAHDAAGQRRAVARPAVPALLAESAERAARAARTHLGVARDAGSRLDHRHAAPAGRAIPRERRGLPARGRRRRQQRMGICRSRAAPCGARDCAGGGHGLACAACCIAWKRG